MAVRQKRCALVGLGRSGSLFLDASAEFPELEIAAVLEEDPRLREVARAEGLPVFSDLNALASRGLPELAIVCVPPGRAASIVHALLRAGADCLVESPLAASGSTADGLAADAERLGRILLSAAPFRLARCVARARSLIREGRIGRFCFLELCLSRKLDARRSWRADPGLAGGGVWMDLGPAALDLAESLAGPVDRLRFLEEDRRQGLEIEDAISVDLFHSSRLRSRIELSWNREPSAALARCVGTDADLLIGEAQLVLRTPDGDQPVGPGFDPAASAAAWIAELLRVRLAPEEFDDDGALAVRWLDAAYRSRSSGRFELA